MKDEKNKNKNIIVEIVLALIVGKLIVKLFPMFAKRKKDVRKNLRDFLHGEEDEVEEFLNHEESASEYFSHSFSLFKDYFIPHSGNNHKPKILRTRQLLVITLILISLKLFVTAYVFFVLPHSARMSEEMSTGVLNLINKERIANGFEVLSFNPILSVSATGKANDMVVNDYFAHYSLNGKKPWDWVNREEYPYLFVGENLAINFSSADSVHEALMMSPSHKKNILNPKYDDVGIAIIKGVINGKETNVLVQHFATKEEVVVASTEPEPVVEIKKEIVLEKKEVDILGIDSTNKLPEKIAKTKTAPDLFDVNISESEKVLDDQSGGDKVKIKAVINNQEDKIVPKIVNNKIIASTNATTSTTSVIARSRSDVVISSLDNGSSIEKFSNKNLENTPTQILNNEAVLIETDLPQNSISFFLLKISKIIYVTFLAFVIFALLVNIFVKATIQHKRLIYESLFVVAIIVGLITVHFQFLEKIITAVLVV